jgi:hypothetical protein
MSQETDLRAEAALLTMQRNRELLLAAYTPSARGPGQFPRSATFRWLIAHLSGGSLASTLLSAALFKSSWLALLGPFLTRRRTR